MVIEVVMIIVVLAVFLALGIGIGYLVLRHLSHTREAAGVGGIETLLAWEKKKSVSDKVVEERR